MNPRKHPRVIAFLAITASASLLASCNLFDPFDSPTSDSQLLSAARACFDAGDIACAQQNYEKLSTSAADIKNSEEAMLAVHQIGAGMGAFIQAFGNSSAGNTSGKAITSVANSIGANASRASRIIAFNGYTQAALVGNTNLRGLSRFVTSLALVAEMLAENATTKGDLLQADIALTPAACSAAGACAAAGSCTTPTGTRPLVSTGATITGLGTLDGVSAADVDQVDASLEILNAGIKTINEALTEMGVTSSSADIGGFTNAFASLTIAAGPPDSPCYRQGLLDNGVGR